jgi:hypothetical protein
MVCASACGTAFSCWHLPGECCLGRGLKNGAANGDADNRQSILARVNGRTQIDVQDIAECEDLFLDARRSAQVLASESGKGFIS